jgi:methylated-DNA-[protein]-cysteine S-methyltransferase
MMIFDYDEFASPIGRILFATNAHGICALDFAGYETRMNTLLTRRFGSYSFNRKADPLNLKSRLQRYFDGDLAAFDGEAVNTNGTAFQEQVWTALRAIPAGTTWSYGQLAAHLGQSRAARAVGHANSLNPVGIIVPCHRVIGASAALTGYAGGLERKRWLLRHEFGARDLGLGSGIEAVVAG